ncbi:glycosyltransferase family 2 protein [Opitutales bacterium]|nr:glycosyltransferase family 2 protein [Opitutales bacterium]MDB2681823.1 glycosyltransferase family 2 protein [Opitutales bacterium]
MIAVLITVHNRIEKTQACLSSLLAVLNSSDIAADIYLVDDGSTDSTAQILAEKFPEVRVIQGDGTLFWNRGMHLAWKTAAETADYAHYLWLNNDVCLFPQAFTMFLKSGLLADDGILVGACEDVNGVVTYSGYRMKNKYPGKRLSPSEEKQGCDYFNGNIVLISRAVFDRVGNLDPIFTHALGDLDYGLRARQLGINSFVFNQTVGQCDGHSALLSWCNPSNSLINRWSVFYTPLGGCPHLAFRFEQRHFGLFQAAYHFVTIHLRVLFPSIWLRRSR